MIGAAKLSGPSAEEHFAGTLDRVAALLAKTARDESVDAVEPTEPIIHRHLEPSRPATFARAEPPLDPVVRARLGVERLWTHQAAAIDAVLRGESTVLTTGTASGKSLVAWAAIGQACAGPRPATALVIHPTKALGRDQLRQLDALGLDGVTAAAYDGDATDTERAWLRRHANVIFTNPEMLHLGMLPRHGVWSTFLRRLRYVVIDETHTLRGIFGGQVAHVLRRLRRLCAAVGAEPTFVFASATIDDAQTLCRRLTGLDAVTVIDVDGSARGERLIAQIDPPLLDPTTGARVSCQAVTATIAADLIAHRNRTIVFTASRHATETLTAAIRRRLGSQLGDLVQSYRAGYLAEERRSIEADLAGGQLLGVVATNALELGIDIGGLDACVTYGFPGTVSSFRQQIGRVGRGAQPSLAVLVAGTDQLDRYLMSHPHELVTRSPEPVVINPSNPNLVDPQLLCAASESPLVPSDERWWGEDLADGIRRCVLADTLRIQSTGDDDAPGQRRAVYAGHGHPANRISLRSGSGRTLSILDPAGMLIGTVDAERALSTLYPGASYLHRTEPFRVVALDFETLRAVVEPDDGSTTTRSDHTTDLELLGVDRERDLSEATLSIGPVALRTLVTGYSRLDVATGKVIDRTSLTLPPQTLVTRATILVLDQVDFTELEITPESIPGSLHAVEHAMISMLPLFAICDRRDVGGISTAWHPETKAPTIAIYDGYPGGAGIAELGFDVAERHVSTTLEMLESCPCTAGCPSCVQSPKCGNANEPLDKAGAIVLLTHLVASSTSSR